MPKSSLKRISVFYCQFLLLFLLLSPAHAKPPVPVIFVHGLASDATSWENFGNVLEQSGWTFGGCPTTLPGASGVENLCSPSPISAGDFYRMQFSDSQNLVFGEQGEQLEVIIAAVLAANPGKSQVVLVGHSMGGLASREYLQFRFKDDVLKLITVGTPHLGAKFAEFCQGFAIGGATVCSLLGIDSFSTAVTELRPGSTGLDNLNLSVSRLPIQVSYTSIIGTGTPVVAEGFQDGDGIVTAVSQNLRSVQGTSTLNHTAKSIFIPLCFPLFPETHTCETSDKRVERELLRQFRLLEAPVDILFLVDLSGSFSDDLPVLQAQAPTIISALKASSPNIRFGLGKFEDYPISPFGDLGSGDKAYERLVDLTSDTDLVLNAIAGLFTRSGGDLPQSQLPALFQAATGAGQDLSGVGFPEATIPAGQQANFRDGATKLFLLWTDASFHQPGDSGIIPYPGPRFDETVNAIKALDPPKVIGISSGTDAIPDLQAIAAATNALAPPGGVDCDSDGTIDILENEPLVCDIASSGEGVGEATTALIEAAIIEPPRCFGVHATIVGSNGRDRLNGTQDKDIIVGLDGNDIINGKGGKDLICGGSGNDKLKGGRGKDKLDGGRGKDKLDGGSSQDICKGGSGRDIARRCEQISRIP